MLAVTGVGLLKVSESPVLVTEKAVTVGVRELFAIYSQLVRHSLATLSSETVTMICGVSATVNNISFGIGSYSKSYEPFL